MGHAKPIVSWKPTPTVSATISTRISPNVMIFPRVLIQPYLRNASDRNTKPVLTANEGHDREKRDIVKGKTRIIPKLSGSPTLNQRTETILNRTNTVAGAIAEPLLDDKTHESQSMARRDTATRPVELEGKRPSATGAGRIAHRDFGKRAPPSQSVSPAWRRRYGVAAQHCRMTSEQAAHAAHRAKTSSPAPLIRFS